MNKKLDEYKKVYDKWGNPDGNSSDSISAANKKHVLDQIKKPDVKNHAIFSGDKDTIDALNQLLHDDFIEKKYLTYLINEILDIANPD